MADNSECADNSETFDAGKIDAGKVDAGKVDMVEFRARQKARNRALGLVLGALVVLFFAITIVKMGIQVSHRH